MAGYRFAIVVSRFNEEITEGLLQGARERLAEASVPDENVTIIRVTGAFEIPIAAQRLGEIRVQTLLVTGDDDVHDIHDIAEKLGSEIPGAQRATMPNTAHLPNLEQPEEFNRIVLAFLAEHEA